MSSYTNPTARLLQNNVLHSYPKSDVPRDSFFSTDSEGGNTSSSAQVTPSASLGDLVGPQHLPVGRAGGDVSSSREVPESRWQSAASGGHALGEPVGFGQHALGPDHQRGDSQEYIDEETISEIGTAEQSTEHVDYSQSDDEGGQGRPGGSSDYQQGLHPNPHFQVFQSSHRSSPPTRAQFSSPSAIDPPVSGRAFENDEQTDGQNHLDGSVDESRSTTPHVEQHGRPPFAAYSGSNDGSFDEEEQDGRMSDRRGPEREVAQLHGQNPHPTDSREHLEHDPDQNGMEDAGGDLTERGVGQEEEEDDEDGSSVNSVPDADIDFTLTYALHTFIATVEGQASVIKGDSLILLDDANSYWWLVRVLKTDGVGYIPAENIETPFERLARLNKHRNVDLATATAEENRAALERERARGFGGDSISRVQFPPPSPSGSSTSGEFVSSSADHDVHRRERAGESGSEGTHSRSTRRKSVVFAQQLTREHPGRIIEDSESETSQSGDEIDGEGDGEGRAQGLIESDRSQDDVQMQSSDTSDEEAFANAQPSEDINRVEQVVRPSIAAALAGGGAGTAAAVARAAGQGQTPASPYNSENLRLNDMDPDDGISWDEGTAKEEVERRQRMDEATTQNLAAARPDLIQRQATPVQMQQGQQRPLDVSGSLPTQRQSQQSQDQTPPMQQTVSGPGRARSSSIGTGGRSGNPSKPVVRIDTDVAGARVGTSGPQSGGLRPSGSQTNLLDPMDAMDAEPRRITATPALAQANELDKIMGLQASSTKMSDQRSAASASRKVSSASVQSHLSTGSNASARSSNSPGSPTDEFGARRIRKDKGGKSKRGQGLESETDDGSIRKKKGVFGGLFKKREKRDKGSSGGIEGGQGLPRSNSFGNDSDSIGGRASDDESSMHSGARDSPERSMLVSGSRNAAIPRAQYASPGALTSGSASTSPTIVSPHGLRLQQIDQQQQALYQQYMARSPTSAPEDASRAYGTQAAATVAQSSAAQRLAMATSSAGGRPGSIMLSPNPLGPSGPMLNVIRIFAGQEVDSQSSFKTALISDATISQDLVKQAVQRFGLKGHAAGSSVAEDYFLTVKGAEGEEYALEHDTKPLEAVNEMAKLSGHDDTDYLHQVRRTSIGSISSVNSDLSLHPAISSKLNDFSDDSAVKLYLHRRDATLGNFGSYTSQLSSMATITQSSSNIVNLNDPEASLDVGTANAEASRSLHPSPLSLSGPERQPSPSAKFTLQLYIGSRDLPDTMCFDPQSDVPVYKSTVRNRNSTLPSSPAAPLPNHGMRRKLLVVARNVTAGEAVEQGLEMFKIMDGVVDGGDDIEDRVGKRRSVVKVRYGLEVRRALDDERQSGMMKASHAVLDAYEALPKVKMNERVPPDARRRSREWSQNGASDSDLQPSDPVFILRRMNNRLSGGEHVPLDDVALRKQKTQDEAARASVDGKAKQEMIAAQRAASRANQQALLTAHANAAQGVDVVTPSSGTLRSAKVQVDGTEKMRYSFIDEGGEAHDVSSLVEDEFGRRDLLGSGLDDLAIPGTLRRMDTGQSAYVTAPSTPMGMPEDAVSSLTGKIGTPTADDDLLQHVMNGGDASDASNRVQAVLIKARGFAALMPTKGNINQGDRIIVTPTLTSVAASPSAGSASTRAISPAISERSDVTIPSRDATLSPTLDVVPASIRQAVAEAPSRSGSRQAMNSPQDFGFRPASQQGIRPSRHRHQPSITSILSQISEDGQREATATSAVPNLQTVSAYPPSMHAAVREADRPVRPIPKVPMRLDDEEEIKRMFASIRARAESMPLVAVERPHTDPLDRLLYGERLDMAKFHPDVQKEWGPRVREMEEMRMDIDALIAHVVEQQKRATRI